MEPLSRIKIDVDTVYENLKDLFTPEEFEEAIRKVQNDFAQLIDREAAALYVAVEAGRIKPKERDLQELSDADQVTISGRITRIDSLRTFNRKDGTTGRVVSMYISSNEHEVRVSFWENRDIENILSGDVNIGMNIKVVNGRVKINSYGTTINVGSYSKVDYSE